VQEVLDFGRSVQREENPVFVILFMGQMALGICFFLNPLLTRLRKLLLSSWSIRSLSFMEWSLYSLWDP